MKVVRPGQLPDQTLEGECVRCRCQIECAPEETYLSEERSSDRYIKCPTKGCDKPMRVQPKRHYRLPHEPCRLGRDP